MKRPPRRAAGRRAVAVAGLALALGSAPAPLRAQSIDGVLLDRETGAPIELGLVTLLTSDGDSVSATLTDPGGRFRVAAEEGGEFLLAGAALGYRATVAGSVFELGRGGSMSLEFRLDPVPIEIGGLTVDADSPLMSRTSLVRNGFVQRAQSGMGRFITPAVIDATTAFSTTELLARTGRVTSRYRIGGDRILMRSVFGGFCAPYVYVDGARISMEGMSLDAFVPLQVLDGVEVYRSPVEAPAQFAMGTTRCGIIVIWTKTGR